MEYIYQLVYNLNLNELEVILETFKNKKSGSKQCLCKHVLNLLSDCFNKYKASETKNIQVYESRQPHYVQSSNHQLGTSLSYIILIATNTTIISTL